MNVTKTLELNRTLIKQILNTSYEIFFDKTSLTLRIYDYSNVYLLPAICAFGIITNALAIVVLLKINKLNENVYLYMMINTVADLLFLMTQISIVATRCGILCPYGYTYGAKFFEVYIYLYFGYIVVTFSALVDMSVSIDRVLSFNVNKKRMMTRTDFYVRCFVLFAISALFLAPIYCISREILPYAYLVRMDGNNETTSAVIVEEVLYKRKIKEFWLLPTPQVFFSIITMIKGPVLIAAVLIVNLFVSFKFKQHIAKKKKVTASK